jgi:flagellar biogenesis protein FliO
MKTFLISKLMMLMLIGVVSTPLALSQTQTAPDDPAASTATETAPADDRLPFMQHEEGRETGSASTSGIILKTFGALLIIVGLIFFAAWGLKKLGYGPKSSSKPDAPELAIISTVTVGSGRTISTIKFGTRTLLVGSTPQSFTLLADGADDEPFSISSPATNPRSVAEMLEAEESFEKEFAKADAELIFGGGRP